MNASAADERRQALDILRGLALFGMILVHFHQKMRTEATGLEDLIGWGVYVLVEQKAWATFAFLFGAGFAILLRRLEARGAAVGPIYLRRLAMLAIFGIVADVGFGFHILFEYACWGVALLLVRRWPTRALLWTAAIAVAARPLLAAATGLYAQLTSTPLPSATGAALAAAAEAAARQGSYPALLSARWAAFAGAFGQSWRDFLPDVNLALFILGLLAVRHGVFDDPLRHTRLIARWMVFGLTAWASSWLVLPRVASLVTNPSIAWPIAYGFGLVQDQWLCFAYIGAVVLLVARRPWWESRLTTVAAAGRMALTNYLVQAAVLDMLSSGYGAGMKLRPLAYVPAAVGLFAIEALFSRAWLARCRYGPLEWVWRSVTYARLQPLRRAGAASAADTGSPLAT